jgi:hypothetical protein
MSHDLINVFSILENDSSILSLPPVDDISDETRLEIHKIQKTIDFILNLIISDSNYDYTSQSLSTADQIVETINLELQKKPDL